MEEGSITGTWDFAHNLQIIWKNTLAQHQTVEEIINLVFQTMDNFRTGKASSVFRERASQLGHLVLSNKKRQTTRFVRSLVRGLQAWFRNLPTLVCLMVEEYNEKAIQNKNTDAREVLRLLSKMRDPRNLLLAVGLAQLLELYVEASLQAQHSTRFPTQAWSIVIEMREKVAILSNNWSWGKDNLVYSGLEIPVQVMERLLETGVYKPMVSIQCVRRSKNLQETNLLLEGMLIKDLFEDDSEVAALAGEVITEVPLTWRPRRGRGLFASETGEDGRGGGTRSLTREDVLEVEEELKELARDIVMEWENRQTQTDFEKAVFAALATKFNWGNDHNNVMQFGVEAVVSLPILMKMKDLLNNVVELLPEGHAEKFVVEEMLEGYSSYLKLKAKELDVMDQGDDIIYKEWYKVRKWN